MYNPGIKKLIVTNNSMVFDFNTKHNIIYDENFSYSDVLETVRNNIHEGRRLLSHPLSGSVKPHETPFKTVLLEDKVTGLDFDGLGLIENSIETSEKFLKDRGCVKYSESILNDFRLIDFDLVKELID